MDSLQPKPHWEAGRQAILNDTGAREPEHTFIRPVPITARVVWAEDGEEYIETVAAGWTGRDVYVRLPDRRYRFTSVWLDASDVRRREAQAAGSFSAPNPRLRRPRSWERVRGIR